MLYLEVIKIGIEDVFFFADIVKIILKLADSTHIFVYKKIDISYDDIEKLSPMPKNFSNEDKLNPNIEIQKLCFPGYNKVIAFVFEKSEDISQKYVDNVYGPYSCESEGALKINHYFRCKTFLNYSDLIQVNQSISPEELIAQGKILILNSIAAAVIKNWN